MKTITLEQYKKGKEIKEKMRILGITEYVEPKYKTITRLNKYRRHKVYNSGVWKVDWMQLTLK